MDIESEGRKMVMKNKVSIVKVDESGIEAAIRKAIDLAGGLKKIVAPSSRVLIKPNVVSPEPSGTGCITDCRVTEAVTKVVQELGPKSVIIGEGAGAGYDFIGSYSTEEAFRVSGTADVAYKLGVELRNLNTDEFEEVTVKNPYVMDKVRIAKTALESDVIIDIPVFKTHGRCLITLSLKNMKGVLPGAEKRKTHRLGLDKAIADLNSVVKVDFVIVDALTGMQGLWEYPKDSVELDLILAGADRVAVDTVGTYLMGFDPARIMHLQYFAERQGVKADLSQVEVVGESLEENRQSFSSSFETFKSRFPMVSVFEGMSACTGCYGEFMGALIAIKGHSDGNALDELIVVMGNPEPGDVKFTDRTLLLGKCPKKMANLGGTHIEGCPPMCDDIIRAICGMSGIDADIVIELRDQARQQMWEETKHLLEQ
ncbi:DUF362 domain-containing protein [candidate division TA06 bacterium]|uniref:DUF362 domain-containing protein n=1 Tax=candidate division TA06 bacterium TaxID=2250710 RepID=A0A523UUT3_UNCT6|nr:MAG: DUF362 domain-containing protein [candidate division TA06 bacterium]